MDKQTERFVNKHNLKSAEFDPDRTDDGKWKKGKPGNPFSQQTQAFKHALYRAVRPEDITEIVEVTVKLAKQPDRLGQVAREFLFDRLFGKATVKVDVDANVTVTEEQARDRMDELLGISRN